MSQVRLQRPGFDGGEEDAPVKGRAPGAHAASQTLHRALDLLDLVAEQGPATLADLAVLLGLSRSTTYRLAAALASRNLLNVERSRCGLGVKILELADGARRVATLEARARPHLERLARETGDTVNLAVLDGGKVRYIDQLPGGRRVEVRAVIGQTRLVCSTGLGKALILDAGASIWRSCYDNEEGGDEVHRATWLAAMAQYQAQGVTLDLEENDEGVRCVAAPIRGADGRIRAALSISGVRRYLDDARLRQLFEPALAAARAISLDLGWTDRHRPTIGTVAPA